NKMEELRVTDALDEIFTLLRRTNKYIDETEPWVLARDEANRDRLATVLYNLLESIRVSGVLLQSFMPETSDKILDMLGTSQRSLDSLNSFGNLETGGQVIRKAPALFARIDEKKFMEELTAKQKAQQEEAAGKEQAGKPAENEPAEAVPGKPEIVFDDFAKIELRTGIVTASEKVKKSKKLLKNQVDLGTETRQILSGIAQYYSPEDMVGRQVIVVTNLAPRKMAGEISEGMILCAEHGDQVVLVSPDDKLPAGSVVC
ncbi:methionine--tRNA ligase subunit beta, partial [uncultured Faecalibaculum sp.]